MWERRESEHKLKYFFFSVYHPKRDHTNKLASVILFCSLEMCHYKWLIPWNSFLHIYCGNRLIAFNDGVHVNSCEIAFFHPKWFINSLLLNAIVVESVFIKAIWLKLLNFFSGHDRIIDLFSLISCPLVFSLISCSKKYQSNQLIYKIQREFQIMPLVDKLGQIYPTFWDFRKDLMD